MASFDLDERRIILNAMRSWASILRHHIQGASQVRGLMDQNHISEKLKEVHRLEELANRFEAAKVCRPPQGDGSIVRVELGASGLPTLLSEDKP